MTRRDSLPRNTPESQGVSSLAILDFVTAAEQQLDSLHSFMVLRHGTVIAEGWWNPFTPELPHTMFSLSKSFTSTAIGLAVSERLLTVDDRIVDLFPDDLPDQISDRLRKLTVRHLLTMSTGHAVESMDLLERDPTQNWVRHILGLPLEYDPGTHFVYNSGATYLLSAIVQKLTGQRVLDYLTPRLFVPLEIEGATWEQSPQGIDTGGWGLALRTEDVANFGQLYLQRGRWNGQQIVPEAWVDEATAWHIANNVSQTNPDWIQGYGYQFWRARHGAYRGDGAFGQFCIVMPDRDAVVVMTAGLTDMQAQIDLVWDHLLPAMTIDTEAMTADAPHTAAATALDYRVANLAITPQSGSATSARATRVSGVPYDFDGGARVTLTFGTDSTSLDLQSPDLCGRFELGHGEWRREEAPADDGSTLAVAASGGWTDASTYVARLCFCETPFTSVVTIAFAGSRATIDIEQNVSFGATRQLHAVGNRRAE